MTRETTRNLIQNHETKKRAKFLEHKIVAQEQTFLRETQERNRSQFDVKSGEQHSGYGVRDISIERWTMDMDIK